MCERGTSEWVACRFGSSVGRVGEEWIGLGPGTLVDRSVDLVGRHVEEPAHVVAASSIEEGLRADHVRRDELRGTLDRPVDMGFSSKVDDRIDVGQEVVEQCSVEDVAFDELKAVAVGDGSRLRRSPA